MPCKADAPPSLGKKRNVGVILRVRCCHRKCLTTAFGKRSRRNPAYCMLGGPKLVFLRVSLEQCVKVALHHSSTVPVSAQGSFSSKSGSASAGYVCSLAVIIHSSLSYLSE